MRTQVEILSILANYKKTNADKYGIEEIGIFGSYAKNQANEESDIDVYVRLKHSNIFLLSRIRIEIENLLGIKTDIVQLREKMNNYLKKHIEMESISA